MRSLDFDLSFAMRYEVTPVDRIDRAVAGDVFAFPRSQPVDPQQELADAPIVAVRPVESEAWIGVFYGDYASPVVLPPRLISWPDERSFCVVYRGRGCVVRADDPEATFEIDCAPITTAVSIPARELVVFGDFCALVAYGRRSLVWRSRQLVWDDLRIERVDPDRGVIHATGYDAPSGDDHASFTVDASTGKSPTRPTGSSHERLRCGRTC